MENSPTADQLFEERCLRERQLAAANPVPRPRAENRKELVAGGDYVVEIEVEVMFYPNDPDEACYRPETIDRMERIAELAKRGDVAALEAEGTVYVRKGLLAASA